MKNNVKMNFTAAALCLILFTGCAREAYAAGIIESQTARAEIAAVSAKQIQFTDGVSRITSGGRYVLYGEHEGQILIEAARSDAVEIVLDGAVLRNPKGQAILAPRSGGVELILADGTVNSISDGIYSDVENNAAVFVQHNLIISGGGTLYVMGNHHHGIRAQDFLTINEGVFYITAAGDALRGRDGVIINGGTFNLKAGGDGIQSNNDSNPEYGFITINGGSFNIEAADDGIQAETNVTINGGNIQITAADDGITAKKSVLISGGRIDILNSYEGIEGLNVTITGGDINIYARDDGINAREYNAAGGFRGRQMRRGPLNPDIYVRITGGNMFVHALRDGIDSNNNIFLEGGSLFVSGPSRGMDGAIDLDGTFLITGGKLVTAGTVLNISRQSAQPVISVMYTRQMPSGTMLDIKDADGRPLLSYTSQIAFSASVFTSPDFSAGSVYSLFINGEKTNDITLNALITSVNGNSALAGAGSANNSFDVIQPGDSGRGRGFAPPQGDFVPPGGFGRDFREMPNPGDFGGRREFPVPENRGRRMDAPPRI